MTRLPSLAACKIVLLLVVPIVAVVAQGCDATPTTTTAVCTYRIEEFGVSEMNIFMCDTRRTLSLRLPILQCGRFVGQTMPLDAAKMKERGHLHYLHQGCGVCLDCRRPFSIMLGG